MALVGVMAREDFLEMGTCKWRKEGASRARQVRLRREGISQAVVCVCVYMACTKAQGPDGRSKVSRKQEFGMEG